ncbi:DUF6428 family protein [Methylobacterium sp. SyP6R]|uniref:DUF6428 family protein n=1 Tax=Methylobacterium sp. SyP6R TaxID=2718876 RepID=UPI001F30A1A3|nr:DUF6428 family protein [Methylobacterium sp. SyP6R]MCF4126800.1 DUF6428 family protein [Methylobacterium sp. SyP6R]
MLDVAKMDATLPTPPATEDIPLGALLAACDAEPAAPLVFSYEGRTIRPGYHVTEVKAGQFAALDCGGNPESWSEIFVQLWDVTDGDRTHMKAGKFAAIIRKVSEHVGLDLGARLTFEVSDGVAPMQLHAAARPRPADGSLTVALAPRAASCKPRDRWLEEQKAGACCNAGQPCCG